jgi:nucleotide-binding universal stress UspA family protein
VPGWELEADAGTLMERHTREGELLQEDLSRLLVLNLHLEAKVRHGLVVTEIQAEANSGAYDLLVIGAHRGEKWERFLLDDLARQIINQVRLPVLVI